MEKTVYEKAETLSAEILGMIRGRLKGAPVADAFVIAESALASVMDTTSEMYGRNPGETRNFMLKYGKYADAEMEEECGQGYWKRTARGFWKDGGGWVSVKERLPETDEDGCSAYVLLSFENYTLPCIGRYEAANGGAFYERDSDEPLQDIGLKVNAWMPLPKTYREQGASQEG